MSDWDAKVGRSGDETLWLGLNHLGKRVEIAHRDLMEWCDKHGEECDRMVFEAGGDRLVRGPMMVSLARSMGWDDLAEELEEAGFVG